MNDTRPMWLARFDDADDEPRPSLLRDIADQLHADRWALIAAVATVALLLVTLYGGPWLAAHADPAWVAAHPVVGAR